LLNKLFPLRTTEAGAIPAAGAKPLNELNMITTTQPIYNGLSIRQIISRFHPAMIKQHRKQYLKTCIEVYKNEQAGTNSGWNEAARNSNFNLTLFYLKP
jgi:hypothetical protein